MASSLTERFGHPVWRIFGGMAAGYLVILLVMTLVLFLLPTMLYSM